MNQFVAWNGETYQGQPPEGWYLAADGRWWAPGSGPKPPPPAAPPPPPAQAMTTPPAQAMTTTADSSSSGWQVPLIGAILAGAAVSVLLGVYGRVHDPTSETTIQLFFTTTLHMKAWLTTGVLVLVLFQLFAALWMYGRFPVGSTPSWLGPVHRLSGTLVLLVSLPVAYHCLWSLGFDPDPGSGGRRLFHSIVGCVFYGAYVTKVISVRNHKFPSWVLPTIGGFTFGALVLVWLSSSWWFFTTVGVEI
jgi:hypothetical protein